MTVSLLKVPGQLAVLFQAIFNAGGNVISVGTFQGHTSTTNEVTIKVEGIAKDALEALVTPLVTQVLDVRETSAM